MPSWSGTLALWTRASITGPSVSTKRWRLECLRFSWRVEAALVTTHSRGLHRLGVHDARAGVRVDAKLAS